MLAKQECATEIDCSVTPSNVGYEIINHQERCYINSVPEKNEIID